ncbi:hypothetical protein D0962_35435 [Leptolyngbyaceae cyanobacterium CCMR0082]|uniref:Uncharacterized protein n=3 Tax=Adonisia TaxID=2950183 RepID=A0A6M0SJ24_9CYAN|nr:hypothetical protein [Adonisia turfae]MDV3350831.1 hypothetical protein [Leptothoe sp. LEGE 181152]NEZ56219.1 hypothetical protein [Adonisia turfae CCMR0081]NEZ67973.1 hypothetical protein [Adonisia turfae CCMR0082]
MTLIKKLPWLSSLLLLLAYMGFGAFLHSRHSSDFIWWLAVIYAVLESALLTIIWKPLRNFFLLGFKSDIGYTIMALVIASLAVVVVSWIQIFVYFLVMLAAALLLRVELLIRDIGNNLAFVTILLLSLMGLALSRLTTELIMAHGNMDPTIIGLWTL